MKPWEFKRCTVRDILDMYDAYRNRLITGNENIMQAQLNNSLHLIAHTVAQSNSQHPKPYKQKPDDFKFRVKPNLRKEFEEAVKNHD